MKLAIAMELLLGLGCLVFLVLVGGWGQREARQQEQQLIRWQRAARALGLSLTGKEDDRSITGVLRGVPVRMDYRRARVGKAGMRESTTIYAGGDGRIPATLVLRKDSAAFGRLLRERDAEIGDGEFDALVELPTLDARVCAVLSAEARRLLARLVRMGGEVQDGAVMCEVSSGDVQDSDSVAPLLELFAKLGGLLSMEPEAVPRALADNARSDPSEAVRLRNLRFLVDPALRAPRELVAETAVALLADGHAPLRLLAAQQLGRMGSATLRELVSDARLAPPLRVEALAALGELNPPELDELLGSLLGGHNPAALACASLALIAARARSAHTPGVLRCAQSADPAVRAAAARALTALLTDGAEAELMRLLDDASEEVQLASAEGLGQIGSVAAVEPLLRIADGFGESELRRAAHAAIGRIQSQLAHVAGAVSLADDHGLAGALTVSEPSAAIRVGELSLSDDDASPEPARSAERRVR